MTAAVVVLAAAVVLLGIAAAALIRNQAELARAVAELRRSLPPLGPPPPPRPQLLGHPAPVVAGVDQHGDPAAVDWGGAPRVVLAFLTSGCASCRPLWAGLGDPDTCPGWSIVAVTPDPSTESQGGVAGLAGGGVRVVMSSEAWTSYGVRGAPWLVAVRDGVVKAERPAAGREDLVELTGS